MSTEQRHPWVRWVQLVVTTSLMVLLVRRVEWSSLPSLFSNLRWRLALVAMGLLAISHLVNVARWRYLLQHNTTGYRTLLVLYGAGLFTNNFLPTGFGGDGVRAALLSRSIPLRQAIFSVGLDRGLGLLALSALLGIGLWIGPPSGMALGRGRLAGDYSRWTSVLPVLVLAATIGLLRLAPRRRLRGLRSMVQSAVVRFTKNRVVSQWTIRRWLRLLSGGYILSVLSHLCIVAANWVMLQAVGIEVTLSAAIWLVLGVTVSLLFPISINGLGVREATYMAILSAYGVASTPALLAASLTRLVLVLFGLGGGIGWLLITRSAEGKARSLSALAHLIHRVGRSPLTLILIGILLGLIRLTTAPALWWDEGWTLTVARNWVETGHYGRFLAGAPISPGLAAAPPVVLPVAFSFRLFGVGAWQGRLPGVIFTALTLWLLYRLTAMLYSQRAGVVVLVLALLTPMSPELHPLLVGKQVLGETPALCFLLAGYLLLFNGLTADRIGEIMGAGLLWSLSVVTKLQVIPFLTLSLAVVVTILFRQRNWRILIRYTTPFLMAAAAFTAWGWCRSTQLAAHGPGVMVDGLLGVTAFVPTLASRMMTLVVMLLRGLPIVASLAYGAFRHLDSSPRGLQRLAMWSLAAGWLTWYLFMSVGWGRYLFPAAFLSLIFFAGFIKDVTDDFDPETLRAVWQRLRPHQWRHLTRPQQTATFLLLLAMPASLVGLFDTYLRADDSVFRLAEYLHTDVPPDALIETYDPEIMFLTDQRYHYPPDQIHVQLNRRTFLSDHTVKIDYDPLAAHPEYLINGPLSKLWNLYPEDLLVQHFYVRKRFGPYELLRFAQPAR